MSVYRRQTLIIGVYLWEFRRAGEYLHNLTIVSAGRQHSAKAPNNEGTSLDVPWRGKIVVSRAAAYTAGTDKSAAALKSDC
ncbi:hypothetical protein GCM10022405_14770 [Gibbsiella dentisursi]|uniref:Uncharacterized protein n=1 Tax=Gibbsiella dentisursi TaxID=796890 RepID=A0ABP7KX80_9GAMM